MQCLSNLRGYEVAQENADCVGDTLADFSAILWIQPRPRYRSSVPRSPLQRSPNFVLEAQLPILFVTGFSF